MAVVLPAATPPLPSSSLTTANPSGGRNVSLIDVLAQLGLEAADDVSFDSNEIVNLLSTSPRTLTGTPLWRVMFSGTSFQWGGMANPAGANTTVGPYMNTPMRMRRPFPAGGIGGSAYVKGRWNLAVWS